MSSKRTLVVAMSLLVTAMASVAPAATSKATKKKTTSSAKASTAPAAEKAPRLTIVEPVKEYGTVPKGEKLHPFVAAYTVATPSGGEKDSIGRWPNQSPGFDFRLRTSRQLLISRRPDANLRDYSDAQ